MFLTALNTESTVDVAIVIALKEEFRVLFEEIRGALTAIHDDDHGDYYYRFDRSHDGSTRSYRCVAAFIGGMNPTASALVTDRMLARWRPAVVVMLGIAGGLHEDVRVGDVVAATQVDAYLESAKAVAVADDEERFEFILSGEVYRPSHELVSRVRGLEFAHAAAFARWDEACRVDFVGLVSESKRHDLLSSDLVREGPVLVEAHIASGPAVGAARAFTRWIRARDRACKALEMEAAGLMAAAHTRTDPGRSLILRGISDYGDERKSELDRLGAGALRRYAMRNALRLLWTLMDEGLLPVLDVQAVPPIPPRRGPASEVRGLGAPPAVEDSGLQHAFWPTRASLSHRRAGPVPHVVWQLEAALPNDPNATRTELHAALRKARVEYDLGDFERSAMWPRILRLPQVVAAGLPDGSQRWQHTYQDAQNEACEEQLLLRSDGTVLFQRDALWDVDDTAVDFGVLAPDALMFIAFAARFAQALGLSGEMAVTLRLRTSQTKPGTLALFHATTVEPEQITRSARLTRPIVEGTDRIAINTALGERLGAIAKHLLDRIANEFELGSPQNDPTRPSFLAINAESLDALAWRVARTDFIYTQDLRRLRIAAIHNVGVFRGTTKTDEDRAFVPMIKRLLLACTGPRDVYLLQQAVSAASSVCRNDPARLTPCVGFLALTHLAKAVTDATPREPMPIDEANRVVSLLVGSGLATAADGGTSCILAAETRQRISSVIGYTRGTRLSPASRFIPLQAWDEACGKSVANSTTDVASLMPSFGSNPVSSGGEEPIRSGHEQVIQKLTDSRGKKDDVESVALVRKIDLVIAFKTVAHVPALQPTLHQYELLVTAKNISDARIDDWFLEIEFPTRMLEPKVELPSRVSGRSSRDVTLLRIEMKPLHSGDEWTSKLRYRVDDDIYDEKDVLFAKIVKAQVFVGGVRAAGVERVFNDLQNF